MSDGRTTADSGQTLPLYLLLIGATMWGLTWWPMRSLRDLGIGGVPLVVLSAGTCFLLLLPFAVGQRQSWPAYRGAISLILLFGGYANLAYTVAIINGNPLRVMLLFYLAPIWSLVGARVFLHERLDALRVFAVFVAVCGAVLTLGGPQLLRKAPATIDLLSISAGFAYAMNNLAYRHARLLPVNSKNMFCFLGALVWVLMVCAWLRDPPLHTGSGHWWVAVVFGAIWYLPAVGLTQYGVSHLDATRSAVLLTLELPIAALSAWLIAGVRMSPLEALGGLLIFAAAMLDSMPRRTEAPASTEPLGNPASPS